MNAKHLVCLSFASTAAVFLSGCMSGVTVTKVTPENPNPKGRRVYLPAPFVVGRPNPQNEIVWTIEYLPDPDEEYAVHAWAALAKNNTDLQVTRSGMLTSATLNMDSTAVATKLAEGAGVVGSAALETANSQRAAAAKDHVEKAQATVDAKRAVAEKTDKLEWAKKDRETAGAILELAVKARKEAEALPAETPGRQEAIDKALKTEQEAEKKFTDAQRAEEEAGRALTNATQDLGFAQSAYDTGTGSSADENESKQVVQAPAAVIYRIVESKDGGPLSLEKVHFKVFPRRGKEQEPVSQIRAGTWGKKKPKEEPKKEPQKKD